MTNNRYNTRKKALWSGWAKAKPGTHERTIMLERCGSKCFLGSKKSFPICRKNTCRIDRRGVYAAFVRSRQYTSKNKKYKTISKRAIKILKNNFGNI